MTVAVARRGGPAAVLLVLCLAACTTSAPPEPRVVRTHRTSAAPRTAALPASGPAATTVPVRGQVLTRMIPSTVSGFAARPALIYLPPAVRSQPGRRLPVLLLLHGEPGAPTDWVSDGHLDAILDRFAATHDGRTPVVVMPDINGSENADTECVGRAEQYLTVDVPRYVLAHLPVLPAPQHWGIGGVSEGGMCSLMLALRHPDLADSVTDLSGLTRPTVGEHDARRATIRRLFHGSVRAYDEHDILWLLDHRRGRTPPAWLGCGTRDPADVRAAQARVASALERGRNQVTTRVVPGGHDWATWSDLITDALPWIWTATRA